MGRTSDGKRISALPTYDATFQETPSWADFEWIREQWDRELVIKGIMTSDDARRAIDVGADAIVVSNHGGNVLDRQPATLRVLPRIAVAVGNDAEVWMDGGVRRGSDVVAAVALGAKAVLIGRAYVFGLTAAGGPGVSRVLEILQDGIDATLAGLGCASISDLSPDCVVAPADWWI